MTKKDPNQRIQNIKEVIDTISWIQGKKINNLNTTISLEDQQNKDQQNKNQSKFLKWGIAFGIIVILIIIAMTSFQQDTQPQMINFETQTDPNLIDVNNIDIHEDHEPIGLIMKDQLIQKIELNHQMKIEEIKEIKNPKKPQDLKINQTPKQPPTKINTTLKNKSAIHELMKTKMLGIRKCIQLYQSDFEHDFLNLNLDFQDGSLYRLNASDLNEQTKLCIKNIVEKLDFSSEINGTVNLRISLPED
jgi:hypothetical protein